MHVGNGIQVPVVRQVINEKHQGKKKQQKQKWVSVNEREPTKHNEKHIVYSPKKTIYSLHIDYMHIIKKLHYESKKASQERNTLEGLVRGVS